MWKNIFPPLMWIRGYSPKDLKREALAGVRLSVEPASAISLPIGKDIALTMLPEILRR